MIIDTVGVYNTEIHLVLFSNNKPKNLLVG